MKAFQGLMMSYKLQQLLQSNSKSCVIRGHRECDGNTISLNNFLYTVLRTNRSHRRAILLSLLNLFDDSAVCVAITVHHLIIMNTYTCENFFLKTAHFPHWTRIFYIGGLFKSMVFEFLIFYFVFDRKSHWQNSCTLRTIWPSSPTKLRTSLCLSSTRLTSLYLCLAPTFFSPLKR